MAIPEASLVEARRDVGDPFGAAGKQHQHVFLGQLAKGLGHRSKRTLGGRVEQVACDRCGTALVPGAAYCDRCGARTRRARRMVRLAVRVEILLILAITAIVIGFSFIFYVQGR